MSAGHTPGPWAVNWAGSGKGGQLVYDEVYVYAPACGVEDIAVAADIVDPLTGKPSAANAALIASAPDLLAERDRLKALNAELVKALEIYAKEDNWCADSCGVNRIWQEPDSTSPEAYDGFDTARAALAKHKDAT